MTLTAPLIDLLAGDLSQSNLRSEIAEFSNRGGKAHLKASTLKCNLELQR